ncbi:hypothetical protein BDY19DRAFT_930691 [Irpex rosettiformis]|uniref:Uncharacterized protein n=1 Tax=Irpex rosettiformis TaxID=378272 RepID=A0ACB8UB54_9APHY|nr:hypothetical protein BDY19DRAFT_930691 [Irpex rosettiformis]
MDAQDDVIKDQATLHRRPVDSGKEATLPEENIEASVPRKREREVSLEPQTPQASGNELDLHIHDAKEHRAPAKKNRVSAQLDAPQEEEEQDSETVSPLANDQGMSSSPPTESKIRQISQGVEDITWQNQPKPTTPSSEDEHTEPNSQLHAPMDAEDSAGNAEEPVAPPLMTGENSPLAVDNVGKDEHAGEADLVEPPFEAQSMEAPTTTQQHAEPTPPPENDENCLSTQGSEENVDVERGKSDDSTVSDRKVPEDLLDRKSVSPPVVTAKRPRDDDTDENPRETKRPTPPPEGETQAEPPSTSRSQTPPSSSTQTQNTAFSGTSTPKLGGFMSYASTSSPFSSVKGPSLFSSKTWTQSGPTASTSTALPMAISPTPKLGSSSLPGITPSSPTSQTTGLKRTGFEAFASSSSPFATAAKRPKSPPPQSLFARRNGSPSRHPSPARSSVSAFSAYATGTARGFHSPAPKTLSAAGSTTLNEDGTDRELSAAPTITENGDADEEAKDAALSEKQVSFAERLRSQKEDDDASAEDDEKKVNLTEQEVQTGEEDEETVYQVRGKLFALSPQNQWKERGTGQLRLNVRREDGTGARLVMRKEAVYTLLLNATLFKGMRCTLAQDPRYIRFSVFEDGAPTTYNLRVSNAKIASELLEEINAHIP